MTAHPTTNIFEPSHYAAGVWRKIRRAIELGPKYYIRDLPTYLHHRRSLGLSHDPGVWVNPAREFVPQIYRRFPPPPHLQEAIDRCGATGIRLTIPPVRLKGLAGAWWAARTVPGHILECGSYRGATALVLAVLARLNGVEKTTILLDTFTGIPSTSEYDTSRAAGEFRPPDNQVDTIRRQAAALGVACRVDVRPGLFEDTLPQLLTGGGAQLAFVHIDANTYSGTWAACHFAIPAVSPGGIVCFDDYNGVCDLGARMAIDQFLVGNGLRSPRPLAGSSAFVCIPPGRHR